VKPGHVGIYIGDNLFAHASSKNGVIVSSMDQDYYARRFMGGRRVEKQDIF
jgi:cell wall-associated NlpC family hydrolase